jgi:hypothetical protein
MENELERGKSYTIGVLLEFLSENSRQNTFLASGNNINLLALPRNDKYVVYEISSIFLHRFSVDNPNSYMINNNNSTLYYIRPE